MTTKTRLPPQGRSYIRKSTGCQMILYFSFSFAVLNSVGEKRNLSVTGQKTLSPLLSISRTFYSISKDTLAPPPVFTLILTISVQKQLTAGHSTAPLLISSMMSWGWRPSTLQPTDWAVPRISLMVPVIKKRWNQRGSQSLAILRYQRGYRWGEEQGITILWITGIIITAPLIQNSVLFKNSKCKTGHRSHDTQTQTARHSNSRSYRVKKPLLIGKRPPNEYISSYN